MTKVLLNSDTAIFFEHSKRVNLGLAVRRHKDVPMDVVKPSRPISIWCCACASRPPPMPRARDLQLDWSVLLEFYYKSYKLYFARHHFETDFAGHQDDDSHRMCIILQGDLLLHAADETHYRNSWALRQYGYFLWQSQHQDKQS